MAKVRILVRKRRKKAARHRFPRVVRWGIGVLLGLWLATALHVLVLKFVNPPFTTGMACKWLAARFTGDEYQKPRHHWRSLSEMSSHLVRAVQAGEDQRFLTHHGFDLIELNQAVKDFFAAGRIRGASTITMQAARSVFLWKDRSWIRKLLEAYYTVLIESFWSKRRILEIYLNTVDWGTDIVGAEAASRAYFHTSASRLTASQAAFLAAVLPSPHHWSPADPSAYVRERQQKIMDDMKKMPLL
jgi:monofunctional biosynthetic peptidoglycan transglycosylase